MPMGMVHSNNELNLNLNFIEREQSTIVIDYFNSSASLLRLAFASGVADRRGLVQRKEISLFSYHKTLPQIEKCQFLRSCGFMYPR